MGRRMYHRSVLNALILSTLFITGCNGLLNDPDSSNAGFIQTKGQIDAIISQIEGKHSVHVYYKNGPLFSWLKFKYKLAPKSDYEKLLKYLAILQKELDKYPKGFLNEAGLKSIAICKELSACGFADWQGKTIYCNYNSFNIYAKEIFHHELYHVIDAKFNNHMYYKDPNWSKFNSADFKYSKGGRRVKGNDSNSKKLFHPKTGFVTPYATSAPGEDKAEVYAGLFVEEISACLHEWIQEDEILRNKVNYMKDFLNQHCSEFNNNFWENLSIGQCSSLEAGSYEIQDSLFSTALSGDVVVELIAITDNSDNPVQWWKPNGELFDQAPFAIPEFFGPEITIDDKLKSYQIFFRIGTDQSIYNLPSLDLPEGKVYQLKRPCRSKGGRFLLDIAVMTCGLDDDKVTSQMLIGVPLDEWTTNATYNPKTKITNGPDRSAKFGKPRKKKGKLHVEISYNIDFQKTARRIIAVDHAGKIHTPVSRKYIPAEIGYKESVGFSDLRLAQIEEFQLRTCPYTWITFENISLRPGQITDVQIKVENN